MNAKTFVVRRPCLVKCVTHETDGITRESTEGDHSVNVFLGALVATHHERVDDLAHKLVEFRECGNVSRPSIKG
jgi:hypothetical protein